MSKLSSSLKSQLLNIIASKQHKEVNLEDCVITKGLAKSVSGGTTSFAKITHDKCTVNGEEVKCPSPAFAKVV